MESARGLFEARSQTRCLRPTAQGECVLGPELSCTEAQHDLDPEKIILHILVRYTILSYVLYRHAVQYPEAPSFTDSRCVAAMSSEHVSGRTRDFRAWQ